MSVIKDAYLELALHGSSLADVVVLSQAWKKSHAFIRRHNWYADVLELDASTVDLEDQLLRWGADVSQDSFRPNELLLVPAPKIAKWEFRSTPVVQSLEDLLDLDIDSLGSEPTFDDWAPKTKVSEPGADAASNNLTQKLRPLAHLSIRDQTLATAVMMCLAEAVETAQGDTSGKDVLTMRERGVVSYGNRLQCNWVEQPNAPSRAKFSWGNSRTYRQYFQDYRAFLARPRQVCAELLSQLPPRRELFVVSLDIKSFFDRIDTAALLQELRRIEVEHRQAFGLPDRTAADEAFWQRAERIFRWQWRSEDHKQAELVYGAGQEELELGLPQGLVASGFLANAYLLRLDRQLYQAAAQTTSVGNDVKLLDYCRYVDDMRMVVEAPSGTGGLGQDAILRLVVAFVTDALKSHSELLKAQKVLELSPDKCVVTPYRSISAQSNMSALMDVLNAELSGTFDLESLAQAAGGLDGLLWMSDQIDDAEEPKPSRLRLATVAAPSTDVRDDTVKRFVATRLAQLMRHRLAMTDATAHTSAGNVLSDRVTNGMALAHEFESTARKLIKCWAENPSLALLLRCGLDLFPHPRLLSPVTEALSVKLFYPQVGLNSAQLRQVRVAEYVLADLLRAGAVETGFRAEEDYPESVDIAGYREDLGALARRVVLERADSPWYLLQQAHLYLSSIGDVSLAVTDESSFALVQPYRALNRAIMFEPAHSEALMEVLPLALVAQQLHPNPRRFGVWLAEGLRLTKDDAMQAEVVTTVSLHRPDLMLAALNGRGSRAPRWRKFVPPALIETSKRTSSRRTSGARRSVRPLHHVMMEADNVFAQENGVLMLAKALLGVDGIEAHLSSGLSAMDITLACDDWTRVHALPDEKDFLSVQPLVRTEPASPLYGNPPWVDDDSAWLYGLGRILRAALTGEFDFTSRRYLVTEEVGHYTGLRSSWFKRRFGLMNSGRGLLDEPGPVSPWLSGLLSTLLRWPGVEFRAHHAAAAGTARTADELLAVFEERIAVQRALFGTRSKTPMYVVPTDDHAPLQDRPLRIAIVQPMRPRRDEFDVKDPTHWTPGVLAEHRRHLAEVCRLTFQKLRTWASAQSSKSAGEEGDGPIVDVILFPELAVHPEHVFLLRRLSDKLGANIFTGLTFQASAKLGAPINQGLWLIRTESPDHGRSIQYVWQGKLHPMKLERAMGVKGYRPHLTLVELPVGSKTRTRIAAAICYDATDLDLVADLRDRSDVFLVAALNQDVQTFDNMVAALHFHMYQPVVLANSGEFGGSTAQAPLPKHERLIAHVHGNNQVAVSVFEVDPAPFKSTNPAKAPKELKAAPAGYRGRPS
ncbi:MULTISPECIES: reverse transcriptase domain-containing protein [unclassified Variovorax]|uniref:RNA-directed DNA polymerase n=1 Tax=unclassified Variovorax TaxID=663243 RepID=UPI003F458F86